ncbi:MAG TPA: SLC13 family permease [Gaiellaceae bacterium]|nr:SLC13 family permease [Gaiellaceae bacterium]
MVWQWIIAVATVLVVALRPRSWRATLAAVCLALAGGAGDLGAAARTVAPTAAFLLVAVSLAALAVRLGADRTAAERLAALAHGSGRRLFVLVCLLTAALTAAVSLDGAVVVMVPVLLELDRRFGAPLRPLLLAVVAVANAFSLALPEGNPTNLVVIERLGLPLGRVAATTIVPGAIATLVCAGAVAWRERAAIGVPLARRSAPPASTQLAPGLAGVVRVVLQIAALLVVLLPLGRLDVRGGGLLALAAVVLAVSALAAVANNLPASTIVAVGLAPGPAAYAALVGLSVGALATPQGSVATLIAGELAGERPHARVFVPAALAAALLATLAIWVISVS